MLGMNLTIKKIKEKEMLLPVNIASKLAKLEAKRNKLAKEVAKLDAQIEEIKKSEVKEIVE